MPETVELCKPFNVSLSIENFGRRNATDVKAWIMADQRVELLSENVTREPVIYGWRTGLSPWSVRLSWEISPLMLGPLRLSIVVESRSGVPWLMGSVSFVFTLQVIGEDTYPPTITIISPSNGTYSNSSWVVFEWEADDIGSGIDHFEVSMDGSAFQNVGTSRSYSAKLSDGPHNFTVKAVDGWNNEASCSVSFKVDTSPPRLTVLSPPNGTVFTTSSVEVDWEGWDENGLKAFRVFVDGALYAMTNETSIPLQLPGGRHEVTVQAEDPAGNRASSTTFFWVDLSPPSARFVHPANGTYCNETPLTILWILEDDCKVVSVEAKLDSGPWKQLGISYNFSSPISDGRHVFYLKLRDIANRSWLGVLVFWADFRSPTIVATPPPGTYPSPCTVSVGAWDDNAVISLHVRINGSRASPTFELSSPGTYVVEVRAVDVAGNVAHAEFVYKIVTPRAPQFYFPWWPSLLILIAALSALLTRILLSRISRA